MARDRPAPYGKRACRGLSPANFRWIAAWRGTGPRPTGNGRRFFHRRAGACPPRTSGGSQHGEGQARALRETGGVFFIVARGPVPRELPVDRSMARDRPAPYAEGHVGETSWSRCPLDRPSPYEEGGILRHSAQPCASQTKMLWKFYPIFAIIT